MELILLWLLFAFTALVIASGKRRSKGGWFLAGFLLGPFALIMVACLPALPEARHA